MGQERQGTEAPDPGAYKELRAALARRYGLANIRIDNDGSIWVRGRKWKHVGRVAGGRSLIPGRPPELAPRGRKITLYLDAESERRASQLGAGNLSLGVRRALEIAVL